MGFLDKPQNEQPFFLKITRDILCFILLPIFRLLNIKFLLVHIYNIGHLAIEPECYLKEGTLKAYDADRPKITLLSAPSNKVANSHLLRYWSDYMFVFKSPLICFFLFPLVTKKETTYSPKKYVQDFKALDFRRIETLYQGPPLLHLKKDDLDWGKSYLRKIGMRENSWFVALHCRENGYIPKGLTHPTIQDYRNSDISDYNLAIEEILRRGGWVIRMGDSSMKPMPKMDRVIDYAYSPEKSDRLDVFLCASCKFFLGSDSGLNCISYIFNIPVALANNSIPMVTALPYGQNSIGIPKLFFSKQKNRLLTFKEIFESPVKYYYLDQEFDDAQLKLIDNSPEEIRDLVLEMFDRIEKINIYTDEDEVIQDRFKQLMGIPYAPKSRIGCSFLRAYSHLLS